MKSELGKRKCLMVAAAVAAVVFLLQTGCRRSGEEKSAEGQEPQPGGKPVAVGEAGSKATDAEPTGASDKVEAPSVKAQGLRTEIAECQARLRTISAETGALHKKIAEARRKMRVENPEVAAMVKEAAELRKNLSDRVHALPATDEKMKQRAELQKQIRELHKRRQDLAERAKTEDAEKLQKEADALQEEIRSRSKTIRDLSIEIEKVRSEVRENDPEVKTLAARLVEKEGLIEAKIKSTPELSGLMNKQGELMAEAREITQRMKQLRDAMTRVPGGDESRRASVTVRRNGESADEN